MGTKPLQFFRFCSSLLASCLYWLFVSLPVLKMKTAVVQIIMRIFNINKWHTVDKLVNKNNSLVLFTVFYHKNWWIFLPDLHHKFFLLYFYIMSFCKKFTWSQSYDCFCIVKTILNNYIESLWIEKSYFLIITFPAIFTNFYTIIYNMQ